MFSVTARSTFFFGAILTGLKCFGGGFGGLLLCTASSQVEISNLLAKFKMVVVGAWNCQARPRPSPCTANMKQSQTSTSLLFFFLLTSSTHFAPNALHLAVAASWSSQRTTEGIQSGCPPLAEVCREPPPPSWETLWSGSSAWATWARCMPGGSVMLDGSE